MDPLFDDDLSWTMHDADGNPITDPHAIIEMQRDIIKFGMIFARYIKENDHDLWKRAGDFAADYTDSKTVKFIRPPNTDDRGEKTHGTE